MRRHLDSFRYDSYCLLLDGHTKISPIKLKTDRHSIHAMKMRMKMTKTALHGTAKTQIFG